MNKNMIILIIVIVLVIVAAAFVLPNYSSNSNSTTNEVIKNVTFNNSGISLQYPESYKETETSEDIISGSSSWSEIFNVYDNSTKVTIHIQKNEEGPSPSLVKSADINSIKSTSGEILSNTQDTISGIKMEKMILKLKDPNTEAEIKYIRYYLKSNGTTFIISFIGSPDNFGNTTKIANDVMNSVQVK